MSWRNAVRRHFPGFIVSPDRRAGVPYVPMILERNFPGTHGTPARLDAARSQDAHVVDWVDWNECSSMIEHEGEIDRRRAEKDACKIISLRRRHENER